MEIKAFDPVTLVLIALINPAVIVVAFVLGRRADQWQKVIVAAFAASLAGFILYWIITALGYLPVRALGSEGGIVLLQILFGLVWAAIGYWTKS